MQEVNILECSDEQFSDWVSSAPLGIVLSSTNMLKQFWERMKDQKDEIVVRLSNPDTDWGENEKALAKTTLNQLYAYMVRIEDRVFALQDRAKVLGCM